MNPLLLLKLLSPKMWLGVGVGLLVLALGVQTLRLNHAKADQLDRTACVKGQPCKPPKWKNEVQDAREQRDAAEKSLKTCQANNATLSASIASQNAAATAAKADADRRTQEAQKAVSEAQAAAAGASKRAAQILAVKPGADRCASADALIIGGVD